MKKIMAVLISIIALGAAAYSAFMIFLKPETTTTTATKTSEVSNQSSSSSTSDSTTTTSEVSNQSSSSSTSDSTTTTSTSFKDGTYTGASTSTEWGDVQLQITVSSGKITNISALTYPNDEGKSVAINQEAIPAYTKEAISNQSADIQAISGATETYKGFTGSLQDAINQAQKGA
ncbi:FMN-binding protein [Streptococcus infantarius]|uniref:FMN-binding protein n=1 Tax=Streptococcus infantarius TaxID=102684 RepID=UPI0022E46AB1|nr:FMN-binding protein [Streptococcus infantarius]